MKLRPGTPEEAGMSPDRVRHVVDLACGWVEEGITPALVVLVARRGVIVIHEAFGRLTPEPDSPPLRRDSIFPLASLTKPITATAAMILVEEGLLGLNRPVQWYIPEFVGEGKDVVMVHHLLTHTSGLRDEDVDAHAERKEGTIEIPPPDETQHPAINERLFLGYDAPLWKAPGTEMSYCNYGYALVGEIARRVSGRSLADFARERIFGPLGMKDTWYVVPDSARHRIVRRPEDAIDAAWLDSPETLETPWAAGGAFATTMDTATFGQMFLNGGTYRGARVFSPAAVAAMTRNQIPGISARLENLFFLEASWGLGWDVFGSKKACGYYGMLCSPQTFEHSGAGGVRLWVDPVHQIVAVYFSVVPYKGVPADLEPAELTQFWLSSRMDLFINAVMAAVVD